MTNEHNDEIRSTSSEIEEAEQLSLFSQEEMSESTFSQEESPESAENADSSALPDEDVNDYVYAHYRRRGSKHRSRSRHHGYDNNHSNQTVVKSGSDQHHRHHNKRKLKKNRWNERPVWQKILLILGWILGVIVGLILIAIISFLALRQFGILKLTDYDNLDMTAPAIDGSTVSVSDSGRTIYYKGIEYAFNENMTSIMCIGVDKDELGIENNTVGTGGQGDALYLIALDTATGETTVIAVPRDIVTDIGIYSAEGEYLRTEKHQICLAYAYGDGRKTSCTNTVTAVSRLFYQLPINSYFSVNLSAIADLNDAVGGVTVTMIDDSFYDTNLVHHYKGETITLYGDNARKYLQQREVSQLESSTDRMKRQINYLESFTSTAIAMTKESLSTPVELYNIVAENSETNLTTSTMTAFASCIVTNGISGLDFVSVPGELTSDGTYAEYVVDEEGLYELILDVYYTPVE